MTPIVVATSTWNSDDIIEAFLLHSERLGVAAVLVMEYGSTDGTRDILLSARWKNLVHVFELPALKDADSSRDLLAIAKTRFAGAWCYFTDPDEFLVTPSMRIQDLLDEVADSDAVQAVTVSRFNMTAPLSKAQSTAEHGSAFSRFTLRIVRGHQRTPEEYTTTGALSPPWIYTAIPGKVLVEVNSCVAIAAGDHSATTSDPKAHAVASQACILHYPVRSYRLFEDKIKLAVQDFAANDYPPSNSWQYRRWIRDLEQGRLFDEYLQQFVPDELIPGLVADGTLAHDDRLRHLLSAG